MVNGIPASCGAHNCEFNFSKSLAPKVASVSPHSGGQDGSAITIYGSGFTSDLSLLSVSFGDAVCEVRDASATEITCTPTPHKAGKVKVSVHVDNVGYSIILISDGSTHHNGDNLSAVFFEYSLDVSSVSPNIGSTSGWNMVTIAGQGFPTVPYSETNPHIDNLAFVSDANFYIIFDSYVCFVVESSMTKILCQPQPHSAGIADVTVFVNGVVQTLTSGYEYSVDKKAVVTSVLPSEGLVSGGNSIVVTGKNFSQASSDNVSVIIGDAPCLIIMVEETKIVCTTSTHPPGEYGVYIFSAKFGMALLDGVAIPDENVSISIQEFLSDFSNVAKSYFHQHLVPKFTYKLIVTGVAPCDGSIMGGTTLTISGSGFGSNMEETSVTTSQGRQCELTFLDDTTIQCTMPSSSQEHLITNYDSK